MNARKRSNNPAGLPPHVYVEGLTVKEAARLAGVSIHAIYRRLRLGDANPLRPKHTLDVDPSTRSRVRW